MTNQEAIADLMLAQADVSYRPKDDSIDMAIKALEQERSRSAEIIQYRHDCEKLMEENERLKKALEQEPKTGHWIPVSERLPNFNDIVLASTNSDYDELRVILTVYSGEEFWFRRRNIRTVRGILDIRT